MIVPSWCSPVVGTGLLSVSRPWPSAVQVVVAVAVNVQVKSAEAPTASEATLAGVNNPAQAPPPVTETLWSATSPLFVSVTVMVTNVPAVTVVPGDTLFVTSVVAGLIQVLLALTLLYRDERMKGLKRPA